MNVQLQFHIVLSFTWFRQTDFDILEFQVIQTGALRSTYYNTLTRPFQDRLFV